MNRTQQASATTKSADNSIPLSGGDTMPENGEHSVRDLALASYLVAKGHPLIGLVRNGWRCRFIFEPSERLVRDELAFLSRQGSVEPLAFHEQVRLLKAMTQVE